MLTSDDESAKVHHRLPVVTAAEDQSTAVQAGVAAPTLLVVPPQNNSKLLQTKVTSLRLQGRIQSLLHLEHQT